jgi:hypothetical protein
MNGSCFIRCREERSRCLLLCARLRYLAPELRHHASNRLKFRMMCELAHTSCGPKDDMPSSWLTTRAVTPNHLGNARYQTTYGRST